LCGVAPIPTGSGQTSGRVRFNPAGDRQANAALWKEGRSKPEIIRLLKRYVAREVYRHLPRR